MRKIAIMDTSIMSFNLGDQIIMESARKELKEIIDNSFVINMPTHSPLFHEYEFSIRHKDSFRQSLEEVDLKFVCGTNLLSKNMKKRKNTWNINYREAKYFNDYILVGVGTDDLDSLANKYTQKLYNRALSHKYIHSVRDEKTKQFLNELGFRAVNTGCVTMWSLDEEHCCKIPKKKSETVVFTVTDYKADPIKDKEMITTLLSEYNKVYCWLQGIMDQKYLYELGIGDKKINYITPSLEGYNNFLKSNECDYVGTRLHAGIKAMQCGKRAIIIGVDNRAKDINDTYHLNYLERENINQLKKYINDEIETEITIEKEEIRAFLGQFCY